MIVRKSKIKRFLAYLLGLLAVQNVIYVFKVSNTYINVELFLGFVSLLILWAIDSKTLLEAIRKTDKSLRWYLLSIGLSIIYLINYSAFNPGTRIISFLNGIISLMLSLSVYYSIVALRKYNSLIIEGLWHGIIINTIVSVLQLVMFYAGSYFSLYDLFPEDVYYVSIKWGTPGTIHLSDIQEWLIYSYRASGLYLECSYFVASMICVIIFCLSYKKVKTFDYIVLAVLTVLIAMSGSGNFIIYIAMLIMYFAYSSILKRRTNNMKIGKKQVISLVIGAGIVLLVVPYILENSIIDINEITNGINESIIGVNIKDEGNSERLTFMIAAFQFYLTYPIGVGYNMASNALRTFSSTYAAFNYFLTVLIELGPIGLVAYLNLWVSNIKGVYKKVEPPKKAIIIGLLSIIIFQFANGTGFTHIVWVLLGVSKAERMKKSNCMSGTHI